MCVIVVLRRLRSTGSLFIASTSFRVTDFIYFDFGRFYCFLMSSIECTTHTHSNQNNKPPREWLTTVLLYSFEFPFVWLVCFCRQFSLYTSFFSAEEETQKGQMNTNRNVIIGDCRPSENNYNKYKSSEPVGMCMTQTKHTQITNQLNTIFKWKYQASNNVCYACEYCIYCDFG